MNNRHEFRKSTQAIYDKFRSSTYKHATETEILYQVGRHLLYEGENKPQQIDLVEAAQLFKQGVQQNHAGAQYELALMCLAEEGGLKRDTKIIGDLLLYSANQENKDAAEGLRVLAEQADRGVKIVYDLQPNHIMRKIQFVRQSNQHTAPSQPAPKHEKAAEHVVKPKDVAVTATADVNEETAIQAEVVTPQEVPATTSIDVTTEHTQPKPQHETKEKQETKPQEAAIATNNAGNKKGGVNKKKARNLMRQLEKAKQHGELAQLHAKLSLKEARRDVRVPVTSDDPMDLARRLLKAIADQSSVRSFVQHSNDDPKQAFLTTIKRFDKRLAKNKELLETIELLKEEILNTKVVLEPWLVSGSIAGEQTLIKITHMLKNFSELVAKWRTQQLQYDSSIQALSDNLAKLELLKNTCQRDFLNLRSSTTKLEASYTLTRSPFVLEQLTKVREFETLFVSHFAEFEKSGLITEYRRKLEQYRTKAREEGWKELDAPIAIAMDRMTKIQAQLQQEQLTIEQTRQGELQCLQQASQQAIETGSVSALEAVKKVVFHVAPELSNPSFKDSVSSLLKSLGEKNEILIKQLKNFDRCAEVRNFEKIKSSFKTAFNIEADQKPTGVNDSYHPYLKLLYTLNQNYYEAARNAFASLQESEIDRLFTILSDLKKMCNDRLREAKNFLEQRHLAQNQVVDVDSLTNLLVPVHRAVVRFEQEHLESVAKSMLNSKKRVLCGNLEAAKIKLQEVSLSDEFSCERNRADIEAYVLGYKTRLEEILSEPKELVQRVEEMCAIEKEINAVFLQPTASMHTAMLTQQKMLLEQKKEKDQEQKREVELFTTQNFIPEKLPLLQDELVLDVLGRLFSHPANVGFTEVQNMLSILRGEGRSVGAVQGHHMFQFPCLWKGYENAPQVLVAPFHTSGMSTQANIVDENILRDLRQACMAAGMGNLGVLRDIARKSAKAGNASVY